MDLEKLMSFINELKGKITDSPHIEISERNGDVLLFTFYWYGFDKTFYRHTHMLTILESSYMVIDSQYQIDHMVDVVNRAYHFKQKENENA